VSWTPKNTDNAVEPVTGLSGKCREQNYNFISVNLGGGAGERLCTGKEKEKNKKHADIL